MQRCLHFLLVVVIDVALGTAHAKSTYAERSHPDCADGRFQCWNLQTIPCAWMCDGQTDCQPLGEDEAGCDNGNLVIRQGGDDDDENYMKARYDDTARYINFLDMDSRLRRQGLWGLVRLGYRRRGNHLREPYVFQLRQEEDRQLDS